jgi:lysozyme
MLWEGIRTTSYEDLAGVTTVCYGYTGEDIIKGKTYSKGECTLLLRKEVLEHSKGVLECVKAPLKENEYNAFVLMAYNVGVSGFCSSRALRLFNEGKTIEACRAIAYSPNGAPNWSYVKGKFVQGLHNRRIYEMKMCLGQPV